jgi:hypothetical protein
MAYRLLARNQPVPQQVALAVQGKLINFINLYIMNDCSNFCVAFPQQKFI